jgi:NADH-quinone oxidoreductase subunit F
MCPTIVNNVETLAAVKHIVAMGGSEYAKLGTPNNTGTRIVSVSGQVKKPGYFEVEVGKVTLGELIFDPAFGGGLRDGRKLKAVIPGGSSAKVFKAGEKFKVKRKAPDGQMTAVDVDVLDLPYDFDSLQAAGSMSGSVPSSSWTIRSILSKPWPTSPSFMPTKLLNAPCREGSLWMSKALHRMSRRRFAAGRGLLIEHRANIQGRTICAFGSMRVAGPELCEEVQR